MNHKDFILVFYKKPFLLIYCRIICAAWVFNTRIYSTHILNGISIDAIVKLKLRSELFKIVTGGENCLVVSTMYIMHHDQ